MEWFTLWLDLFDPPVYAVVLGISVWMAYVASRPGGARYVMPILWAVLVLGCGFLLWGLGGSYDRGIGSLLTFWAMPLLLGAGPLLGWLRGR